MGRGFDHHRAHMEELKWLDITPSQKDKELLEYQEYLIKIMCAIFNIPRSMLITLPSKWWHRFIIYRPIIQIVDLYKELREDYKKEIYPAFGAPPLSQIAGDINYWLKLQSCSSIGRASF